MSQDQTSPVNEWMLKAIDGREYGPVTFDCLRSWAAQNRFTAGYAVSNNRKDWRPVEAIPGLGLDWFVEPGDGVRYGPFHPLALMDYIREGSIPPETRVIHKGNGGEAKAFQVLLEAFVDAIDQTTEEQTALVEELTALREKKEERDRWFSEVSRKLQEEVQKRQELEMAARRPPDELSARIEALQLQLAELERSLSAARQENEDEKRAHKESRIKLEAKALAEREEADKRVRKFEAYLRDLAAGAAEEKRAADGEIARLTAELKAAAEKASAETDAIRQAQEAQEALAAARESALRQRREDEERVKQAEVRSAEAAAAASRAEGELASLRGRVERDRQVLEAEVAARTEAEKRIAEQSRELEEQREAETRWRVRADAAEQELRQARERLHAARREAGDAKPAPGPVPPPRQPGVLAGLEARAQAELKAWREKNQPPVPAEPLAAKSKTWMPWKKS